MILDDVQI